MIEKKQTSSDTLGYIKDIRQENKNFVNKLIIALVVFTIASGCYEIIDGILFEGKFSLMIPNSDYADIAFGVLLILGGIAMMYTHLFNKGKVLFKRASIVYLFGIWTGLSVSYMIYAIVYGVSNITWLLCLFPSVVSFLIAKVFHY